MTHKCGFGLVQASAYQEKGLFALLSVGLAVALGSCCDSDLAPCYLLLLSEITVKNKGLRISVVISQSPMSNQ